MERLLLWAGAQLQSSLGKSLTCNVWRSSKLIKLLTPAPPTPFFLLRLKLFHYQGKCLSAFLFFSSFPVQQGLKAAPALDEVLLVSLINEPELTSGQSNVVGVTAPVGTAKWLNSDKFIVVRLL